MNVENIRKVIDVIKQEDKFFSMENYSEYVDDGTANLCRTPACICGWANFLAVKEKNPEKTSLTLSQFSDHETAGEFLGLETYGLQNALFYGENRDEDGDKVGAVPLHKISREDAIVTLENLLGTGKVDWSHCEGYTAHSDEE